ncbi:MAG TPA: hypothetical protein VMU22_09470 [Rhizomicrobium sp.]|nr:hypothetical protein [Rhizomicrobium sp.]
MRLLVCVMAALAAAVLSVASAAAADAPRPSYRYVVRFDRWTDEDEKAYAEFIQGIGDSQCRTVDSCLHGVWNPFAAGDASDITFHSDCAELPYVLRTYFAWKRGLPFSYESDVAPLSPTDDVRYTIEGNEVTGRRDVLSGAGSGYQVIDMVREAITSASYRIGPELEEPNEADMYSPAIDPKSIRPGTMVYDPNGHVAIIYRVYPNGRLEYFDAHPDESVTRGFFDERFVRARPAMGAGFKNWRPMKLVGAKRGRDGSYIGGHVELAKNAEIADFSTEQYFGNGTRPSDDLLWGEGSFTLDNQIVSYYDYVRAKLAGGKLEFDPVQEVGDMVDSNCNDLHYRADAVNLAIAAGLSKRNEPDRLPPNIYGTYGDWEVYSTPSRDARLKTSFKELRDAVERFVGLYRAHDPRLVYHGSDLVGDLIAAYDHRAAACKLSYARSDGSQVFMSYEDARRRLFLMSFDPYQCIERRWGATEPRELSTCRDGAVKQAWYEAEQNLRNQIDRTYDARMDFSLEELKTPGDGKGVASPPDIDARGYLVSVRGGRGAIANTVSSK